MLERDLIAYPQRRRDVLETIAIVGPGYVGLPTALGLFAPEMRRNHGISQRLQECEAPPS